MDDETIIKKYGKGDQFDEARLRSAKEMAGLLDKPVFIMFESLIKLEDKGFIKIDKEELD